MVRGVRRLPRHDGADRAARRRAPRRRCSGTTKVTFRGNEIDFAPPWQRVKFVDALEEHGLWTRDEAELRAAARGARRRRVARSDVGEADRPRALALRRAGADPADDPLRLPDRAVAVRAHDRRRPDDRRAVRVLRRRHRARQRVHRDQRREEQAERFAVQQDERAGRRRRGRGGRSRLRRGAVLRHAADGRHRPRHRPARDAVHRAASRSGT